MHRYYYRCIISTFKLFNPFILSVFSASQSICGRCQTPASEDSWPIPDRQVQQYSWLLRTATAFFKSRLRFSTKHGRLQLPHTWHNVFSLKIFLTPTESIIASKRCQRSTEPLLCFAVGRVFSEYAPFLPVHQCIFSMS